MFLTVTKIKKCMIKLLIITLIHQNLTLIPIWLKKCVIKLLKLILLQQNLYLKAIRLKKCVIKAVNRCFFVFDSIPDWYKTQEKCKKIFSPDPFLKAPINIKLKESLMKAGDDSLAALNVTPDWFVTSKIIKKLLTALYGDDNILWWCHIFL